MSSPPRKMMTRTIGAIVYLVGALIVLPVLAYEGCQAWETPHAYYANLDEVRADNAIERGWIPPVLPESARNISEWHDLDTNKGEFRFQFDPKDADAFLAKLTRQGDDYIYRDPENGTIFHFTIDTKRGTARARHH